MTLVLEDEPTVLPLSLDAQSDGLSAPLGSGALPAVASESVSEAMERSGAAFTLATACAPVRLDLQQLFGRTLSAAEYSVATGEADRRLCVVEPASDLNDAIRIMTSFGADVLLVAADRHSKLASDVVGVVTKTAICKEISAKSRLQQRDRTLRMSIATS